MSRLRSLLPAVGLRLVGFFPLVGVVASAVWLVAIGRSHVPAGLSRLGRGLSAIVSHPITCVVVLQAGYVLFETILWLWYRPFVAPPDTPLPFVSVVIPAFNEGPMVEKSIRSVVAADYPADRLEILVVDDGSRDDTFFHMERLRREYPDRVRLLRFAGNRGKRAALHAGFVAARGEIVVTIDSDSQIEIGTLRALVAPMQVDPRIGAVAGRVAVLNRRRAIPGMLDVQYALAFDFGRAAQSAFRAVACCPGALSALRRSVILPHLDRWLDQRFFGRPIAHGEDQSLTNIVLRQGYDTVYQRTAVIHTLAPEGYRQLCRMLLRWDRSYVVEGFSFAGFMFTRYRPRNRVLPAVHFILSNIRLLGVYVGLVELPFLLLANPNRILDFGVVLVLTGAFTALYYLGTDRSLRFLYGVAYVFYAFLLLQWIFPWAVVTARDERWGTR